MDWLQIRGNFGCIRTYWGMSCRGSLKSRILRNIYRIRHRRLPCTVSSPPWRRQTVTGCFHSYNRYWGKKKMFYLPIVCKDWMTPSLLGCGFWAGIGSGDGILFLVFCISHLRLSAKSNFVGTSLLLLIVQGLFSWLTPNSHKLEIFFTGWTLLGSMLEISPKNNIYGFTDSEPILYSFSICCFMDSTWPRRKITVWSLVVAALSNF
jgi:hypothetical protein